MADHRLVHKEMLGPLGLTRIREHGQRHLSHLDVTNCKITTPAVGCDIPRTDVAKRHEHEPQNGTKQLRPLVAHITPGAG